jgi:hypothetical protein
MDVNMQFGWTEVWFQVLLYADKVGNEPSSTVSTTMAQGQAVSEAIQWTIIRLSATMPSHEISGYTDISDRKIRDILAHFKRTGGVKSSKRDKPTLHGSLQDEDIQVLFTFKLLGYTDIFYKASFQNS